MAIDYLGIVECLIEEVNRESPMTEDSQIAVYTVFKKTLQEERRYVQSMSEFVQGLLQIVHNRKDQNILNQQ